VLTGIGTIKDDDPQLNVREIETPRQPLKIVVDSRLQMPLSAKVLASGKVLVAAAVDDRAGIAALQDKGAEVLVLPNARGKVDLAQLMRELARRELNEVHVEAGFKLNGSLLGEGLVDELLLYLAPSILGDSARGMFGLPELADLAQKRLLQFGDMKTLGGDLRILARVVN